MQGSNREPLSDVYLTILRPRRRDRRRSRERELLTNSDRPEAVEVRRTGVDRAPAERREGREAERISRHRERGRNRHLHKLAEAALCGGMVRHHEVPRRPPGRHRRRDGSMSSKLKLANFESLVQVRVTAPFGPPGPSAARLGQSAATGLQLIRPVKQKRPPMRAANFRNADACTNQDNL